MEGLDRTPADATPSSSSSRTDTSLSSSTNVPQFGSASTDSSSSTDPQLEENEARTSIPLRLRSYDERLTVTENEENLRWIQDNSWSCVIVILAFWFFVSIIMIMGVYGSSRYLLGPNSSILIRSNPLFVEFLKVEELEEATNHPTLYGFYRTPALDVVTTWSETLKTSLPPGSEQEWVFFLNQGSCMNVSYNVTSPGISLIFVIAQGSEPLSQWFEDPSYSNAISSWNTIHGSGSIQQHVYMPSSYRVALVNFNVEAVEVELTLEIRAFLYNTSGAYYKCSLSNDECILKLSFNEGSIALLTSPSSTSKPTRGVDKWYVKLSYGPRWMTYIVGTGMMTAIMFLVFHLLNDFECRRETRDQLQVSPSDRTPLLSNKDDDDDLSSWDSSDSVLQDDEDVVPQEIGSLGPSTTTNDGSYSTRRLCAICFDAPRDCFFLPCGHFVACFACGTRIAEAAGTCPICRRHMKKVRKIFTV